MSSKRAIRRRQCDGKVKHETIYGAAANLRRLVKRKPELAGQLRPYLCRFCKQYHFGHMPTHVFAKSRAAVRGGC